MEAKNAEVAHVALVGEAFRFDGQILKLENISFCKSDMCYIF